MDIQVLHMVEGVKAARGLTVIIDVFRAFMVETYLMHNNTQKIIPMRDVPTAFTYQKEYPGTVRCGKRVGVL